MKSDIVTRIVKACAKACMIQGCALTGGETTEQPDVINDETYILGSSIVGIVEKNKIIDGSKISTGNCIIGLASSGPHTNGYTLIRDLLKKNKDLYKTKVDKSNFLDAVLEPHFCYYNSLKDLFDDDLILGMAHITGGGIKENLNRILPNNINAQIELYSYKVPAIFKIIKEIGNIQDEEMLRTFNLGIGLVLVTKKDNANYLIEKLLRNNVIAYKIGETVEGYGKVECTGKFKYN